MLLWTEPVFSEIWIMSSNGAPATTAWSRCNVNPVMHSISRLLSPAVLDLTFVSRLGRPEVSFPVLIYQQFVLLMHVVFVRVANAVFAIWVSRVHFVLEPSVLMAFTPLFLLAFFGFAYALLSFPVWE